MKREPATESIFDSLSSLLQGGEGQGEEGLAARKVPGVVRAGPVRLADATAAELSRIEISPLGDGLHWPALDADLSVPGLLAGIFGSKRWMAAQLGAAGGRSRSAAKAASSRENGRKGGRPRKAATA